MSERSVSENNKLWEAAERVAEEVVAAKKIENEEERRKQKKRIVKLILLMTLIALIIVFASIAWFAMNKSVSANTMAIEANGGDFEIATTGSAIRSEEQFKATKTNYSEGFTSGNYKTSQNTDSLILRFTPDTPDDPETENIDESDVPIGPDSKGELSLYIIPKRNGTIDATIDLNIISFKAVNDNSEETLIEINDDLDDTSGLTNQQIADCKEAAEYLKGHIMFFEGVSTSPSSYSYIKPVIDEKISFHQENAVAGTAYRVPIYWTWANTLGQIASKTGQLREGTPVVQETTNMGTEDNPTDKALVLSYLKTYKNNIFKDLDTVAGLTSEQKTEYDALETDEEKAAYLEEHTDINSWIDNADTAKYFDLLSDGYNAADFMIGTNLNYFLIEVSVTSGN